MGGLEPGRAARLHPGRRRRRGDFIGESYAGGTGGHGALVQGGFVYASESSFAGGRGGQGGDEDGCVPLGDPAEDGGDGGDGLRLAGSVHGELVAFQGSGGAGGAGGLGNCGPNGSAGSAGISLRLVSPSTANTLPYAPRRLSAPGLWRGGTPVTLTLKGAPGDLAVLILAPRTAFRFLPARKGVALLGGFGAIVPLGSLDASGSRQVTLTPLDPPAPLQGLTLQLQAWTSNAATGAHLSGAATAALVDSSF